MNALITKSMKDKKVHIVPCIVAISIFVCTLLTGGLDWNNCIVSAVLLTVCAMSCIGKLKLAYNVSLGLLVFFLGLSLLGTKGDFQTGLYETEKLVMFVAAYFAGVSQKNSTVFFKAVLFSALSVAFVGIMCYCKIITFEEFTFNDNTLIRLQSFFKYANTAACFLGCGYFVFLREYTLKQSTYLKCFGAIILVAMYLTVSKACIPIFLLTGTFLIYKNRKTANLFIIQNLLVMVFTVLVLFLRQKHINFLSFAAICGCVAICSTNIFEVKRDCFRYWLVFMGICIIGGVTLVLFKPGMFSTFYKRLEYMKDALELLKINPLFGCGPGSWRVMQFGVQSKQYYVAYLHNGILQLAVENGLLFAALFVGLVAFAAYRFYRKKDYELFAVILLIILHSLLDFDLSFGSILIVLGIMCGMTTPELDDNSSEINSIFAKITGAVVVASVAVSGMYMITEYTIRASFENEYIGGNYTKAMQRAIKLEKLCPKDSQLQITIAALEEKTENNADKILQRLSRAVEMSPYDPEIYRYYMTYAATKDNLQKLCINYMQLRPKHEDTYTFIKSYIKKSMEERLISRGEGDRMIRMVDEYRRKENVIDRNELLNELTSADRVEIKRSD